MMQNKTVVLGVTGTIGSGKSTFSRFLSEEASSPIIDADFLSKEAVKKGSKGLTAIEKYFGREVLTKDGALDRAKMAKIVFSSPEKKAQLESIIHPFVIEETIRLMKEYKKNQEKYVIYECPLLFECRLTNLVDYSVLVICNERDVTSRLIKNRSMSEEEITERLKNQMSVHDKKKLSDFIIDNNSDEKTLRFRARQLLETLDEMRLRKENEGR